MASVLELVGLRRRFGALTVADEIDLIVDEGEALGIIGPNGAGKTTLFNLITGDLSSDSGTVRFDGHDVTGESAASRSRRGIGRTYQVPRPFGHMTVLENLLVAAEFSAGRREHQAVGNCVQILDAVGLFDAANRPAGNLNLLQRKRLELARAMATEPKLILLDEVAGGLTEPEYEQLIETIQSVRLAGATIIWIEHIVKALLSVVERLIVIDQGRIIGDGVSADVLKQPRVIEVYTGIAG